MPTETKTPAASKKIVSCPFVGSDSDVVLKHVDELVLVNAMRVSFAASLSNVIVGMLNLAIGLVIVWSLWNQTHVLSEEIQQNRISVTDRVGQSVKLLESNANKMNTILEKLRDGKNR